MSQDGIAHPSAVMPRNVEGTMYTVTAHLLHVFLVLCDPTVLLAFLWSPFLRIGTFPPRGRLVKIQEVGQVVVAHAFNLSIQEAEAGGYL